MRKLDLRYLSREVWSLSLVAALGGLMLMPGLAAATPLNLDLMIQPVIFAENVHTHYHTDTQKFDVQGVAWSYASPTTDMDKHSKGTMIWDGVLKICAFIDEMGDIIMNDIDELEITGWAATRTDTLLTGNLVGFGFPDNPQPGDTVMWEFVFEVTGGELSEAFGGLGAPVAVKINDPTTTFDGSWDVDFWNDSVDSGTGVVTPPMPMPEPGVAMLLLAGLAGIGMSSNRRLLRRS